MKFNRSHLTFTAVLLAVLLVIMSFASCKRLVPPDPDKGNTVTDNVTDTDPVSSQEVNDPVEPGPHDIISRNPDITYTYTDEQYAALYQNIDRLTALLTANDPDSQDEFLTLYEAVESDNFAVLSDQYMIANILNMVYSYDSSYSDVFLDISEKYNDTLQVLIMMYDDIDTSVYADAFYDGWSDDERAQAVAMAKGYTDELKQLKISYDELIDEYYSLPDDANFMKKSAEVYMRAISLNKQIAQASGYDSYMEYAYDLVYNRDYGPEQVDAMKKYVKQYIVPQLKLLYGNFMLSIDMMSAAEFQEFSLYMNSDLSSLGVVDIYPNENSTLTHTLDRYLSSIGEDMNIMYHDMWKNNHYIVANNADVSRSSAFSVFLNTLNYPMFYFGPGYQGTFTVIHEFGHCYAMANSGTSDIPLDLAEVHSQGNEWLFTSYLKGEISSTAYKVLAEYKLFNDLCSICNCVAINEFEMHVYNYDNYTAESLDYIMTDILKELGIYDLFSEIYQSPASYWHYVVIDNPGYYISYAMSLLPSLNLYTMSMSDYETAAMAYRNICTVGKYDTFLGVLSRAGISSPFEEKTYTDIVQAVTDLIAIKIAV